MLCGCCCCGVVCCCCLCGGDIAGLCKCGLHCNAWCVYVCSFGGYGNVLGYGVPGMVVLLFCGCWSMCDVDCVIFCIVRFVAWEASVGRSM